MNLKEFDEFRLSDAIKFHDTLNPELFTDSHLDEDVREQLLKIAEDFKSYLGVNDLEVKDVVITGSNAAFTYTPHSDIDLHLVVDIEKLKNDDVYKELFNAKKIVYNDRHDIKIRGYDVELYVEDTREPAKSLGEYSVLKNRWIKYPSKRRVNFDERSTIHKFQKLIQLIELALRSDDIEKVDELIKTIGKYRRAGLDVGGEFSPENLAFKAVRSHGIVDQLYDHSDDLHSKMLSIQENEDEYSMQEVPIKDVMRIHKETQKRLGNIPGKLIWLRPNQLNGSHTEAELKKMGFKKSITGNWGGTTAMWDKLYPTSHSQTSNSKEVFEVNEASGYIPSKKEKNDWRWKTALTVDIKPDSIKKNAKKLGLGNIRRDGIPPVLKTSGKF